MFHHFLRDTAETRHVEEAKVLGNRGLRIKEGVFRATQYGQLAAKV